MKKQDMNIQVQMSIFNNNNNNNKLYMMEYYCAFCMYVYVYYKW